MNDFKYKPNYPIVLGLSGKAATGKTSVAENIVPKAQINSNSDGIYWDHIYFALPIYEMASAKKNIQGFESEKRKLFALHEILYDIYGGSALGAIPAYDDFVGLVKNIYSMPMEDGGLKPRSFLQKAGDLCRSFNPNCFAEWGVSKANSLYRSYVSSLESEEEAVPFCVIISDVRFENEAEQILKNPNGLLVVYEASDSVRQERIFERDGIYMTSEQLNHHSENMIDTIKEKAHLVVDSDNLDVDEQTSATLNLVNNLLGTYA